MKIKTLLHSSFFQEASSQLQCPLSSVQCPASTAAVSSGQNWCVLTNRRFSISFHWGGAACRKVSGSGTGKGNPPQANDKNLNQRTRTTTNLNLIMMTPQQMTSTSRHVNQPKLHHIYTNHFELNNEQNTCFDYFSDPEIMALSN